MAMAQRGAVASLARKTGAHALRHDDARRALDRHSSKTCSTQLRISSRTSKANWPPRAASASSGGTGTERAAGGHPPPRGRGSKAWRRRPRPRAGPRRALRPGAVAHWTGALASMPTRRQEQPRLGELDAPAPTRTRAPRAPAASRTKPRDCSSRTGADAGGPRAEQAPRADPAPRGQPRPSAPRPSAPCLGQGGALRRRIDRVQSTAAQGAPPSGPGPAEYERARASGGCKGARLGAP